ncbi:hypothetical protein ADUPG1_009211 [Aduncisulcus paluster]|uniref:Uncharacterized protein n=1 Tax=Aduncisulcus paluster TaxID=2918883 RepID=A0ABQ5KW10_9EUKA|nr:hypothetical protein ADUPG1_009211 [Aduncisulcus paluster]
MNNEKEMGDALINSLTNAHVVSTQALITFRNFLSHIYEIVIYKEHSKLSKDEFITIFDELGSNLHLARITLDQMVRDVAITFKTAKKEEYSQDYHSSRCSKSLLEERRDRLAKLASMLRDAHRSGFGPGEDEFSIHHVPLPNGRDPSISPENIFDLLISASSPSKREKMLQYECEDTRRHAEETATKLSHLCDDHAALLRTTESLKASFDMKQKELDEYRRKLEIVRSDARQRVIVHATQKEQIEDELVKIRAEFSQLTDRYQEISIENSRLKTREDRISAQMEEITKISRKASDERATHLQERAEHAESKLSELEETSMKTIQECIQVKEELYTLKQTHEIQKKLWDQEKAKIRKDNENEIRSGALDSVAAATLRDELQNVQERLEQAEKYSKQLYAEYQRVINELQERDRIRGAESVGFLEASRDIPTLLEAKEQEFESKKKELEEKERKFESKRKEPEAKEQEFESKKKELEEKAQELQDKEDELESIFAESEKRVKEVEVHESALSSKQSDFVLKEKELQEQKETVSKLADELEAKEQEFESKKKEFEAKEQEFESKKKELEEKAQELQDKEDELESIFAESEKRVKEVEVHESALSSKQSDFVLKEKELQEQKETVSKLADELVRREQNLEKQKEDLSREMDKKFQDREASLTKHSSSLSSKEQSLKDREDSLSKRSMSLTHKEQTLREREEALSKRAEQDHRNLQKREKEIESMQETILKLQQSRSQYRAKCEVLQKSAIAAGAVAERLREITIERDEFAKRLEEAGHEEGKRVNELEKGLMMTAAIVAEDVTQLRSVVEKHGLSVQQHGGEVGVLKQRVDKLRKALEYLTRQIPLDRTGK